MLKFTFLWILIQVAMTFFFIGFYKNIVSKIAYILWVNDPGPAGTTGRDTRVRLPFPSMKTIFSEAVIQKRIENRSTFLWVRHMLIFLGFALFFILSQIYPFVIEVYPIDYFVSGAGRGYLKFGLEVTGLIVFTGVTSALIHRIVFAEKERVYVDVWLVLLLWSVLATGFMTEAFRFAKDSHDVFMQYSIVAGPLGRALRELPWPWDTLSPVMWTIHVMLIALFFACIPFTKFVHMFVAPLGRSVTMGQDTSSLKREKIAEGLL